jgi:hypothetical protein
MHPVLGREIVERQQDIAIPGPRSLSPREQEALQLVRAAMPKLAAAYDFKEAFYAIYDEADKASAMHAFEAWENTLPRGRLSRFHALARTVHNFYDDIFAYWDAPRRITNAYTEALNGLVKIANRMGRGYSYEVIRAKTLYAKQPRKVGSMPRPSRIELSVSTIEHQPLVEYGPHIPTLVEMSESGEIT